MRDWHFGEDDFFRAMAVEKKDFMALAKKRELRKNHIIFCENDPGTSCFYVEKGVVRIFKTTPEGKEPIFFLRKQGDFFGLAEIIDARPRKADAQTITPCVLHEIAKDDFEKLLRRHPAIAQKVIQILGKRIRYLGEQVENLMVRDVTTRLAKLLMYLGHDALAKSDAPVTISPGLTQEQMACMTGSCQQTVSEILKKFQQNELISVSRKKITLLDPLKLMVEAENRECQGRGEAPGG